MKKLSVILSLLLCLCMLASCVGTPVIYHMDCDCPEEGKSNTSVETKPDGTQSAQPVTGALKTGLALITSIGESSSAAADKNGEGKYDVTMAAVLVDDDGIIRDCIIDGISASVKFDDKGQISSDLSAAPATKNELGDAYGMVAYGGAVAEWDKQAAALASFAVGKTASELRNGAVDETGKAPEGSDLASSATIYLGGCVSAVEKAVANASHLGAMSGDTLKMAALTSLGSSKSAEGESSGNAQLDADVTALTMKDGIITSCVLDSVQAKVAFDASGTLTSDITSPVSTKTELGDAYGMVAWAGAVAEWYEQAASFAAYVTGKTPDEVANTAVNESTAPTEADLTSSVTIAVGGFMSLITKAAQ